MDKIKIKKQIQVRYSEVDKMGRAYNSHYFTWFEIGRTEFFRKKNIVYKDIENKKGFFLPVREAYCKFKKPCFYDDILNIETQFEILDSKRIKFNYLIKKESDNNICAKGFTVHVFIDKESKMYSIPSFIKEL
ncbi:MAG: acyl-CoA thioesterase [Candidatus Muiribacteriota bacterium]